MTTMLLPGPESSSAVRLPFQLSLNQKIGAVFAVILVTVAINVMVVRDMLADTQGVAATTNIAGKLRYLSQQIALQTVSLLNGWSPGKLAAEAHIHDYDLTLRALIQGGHVHGYDIQKVSGKYDVELAVISRDWQVFKKEIEETLNMTAASAPSAIDLARINEGASRMLANAERLLQSMTIDAQQRQDRALGTTFLLLLIDFVVLSLLSMLVRQQIVRPLRRLAHVSRAHAAGDYHVRAEIASRDEIGLLGEAFNHSAQHIANLLLRIDKERQHLRQAEMMFVALANNADLGVYIAQDAKFLYANEKMAQLFGYEPEEMTSTVSLLELVPDDERLLGSVHMERRNPGEQACMRYERQVRRKDGQLIDVEIFGSTTEVSSRAVTIGLVLDISERKKAETSMLLASLVYAHSGEAMTITDDKGIIIDINPAFTRITGYTRDEAVGQKVSMLRSGRHDPAFYEKMWHELSTTGHWQGEIWNRRKNGELYAEWLTINTSYHTDGSVHRRIALFSDITQKKKVEDLVWEQANFDALTRLPSRVMFRTRLEQEVEKAQRAGLSMALMFIDLDRFKEINDTLGHAIGDDLLRQASQRLRNCLRESDMVARLGGDEFTVIMGELGATIHAERVATEILHRLSEPFDLGEEIAYISASVGITFYPEHATDIDDLLKNADQAMYAAKEQGRNRFHYFTPSMQEKAQARRRIASDLHKAITQKQFRVYYQPMVDLHTGRITKAEALLRWEHPTRGLISPADFIPIAEDTGQIVEIGNWVFKQAVRQLSRWHRFDPDFQISVNTSPVQYRNGGIGHDSWFEFLEDLGMPPNGIAIEITEGLLLDTSAAVNEQLRKFRDAGLQVSLDDFGTGYSSLSYLNKLPIDYLKIDRSFAVGLGEGSDKAVMYEAMIVMAHKLGIKVVAEGVETEEQRRLLQRIGCDYGQGYLFSRPVPAEEFEALLAAEEEAAAQRA